jgi:hypothetical protein
MDPSYDLQQRGLAGAVFATDGVDPPSMERDRDIVEDFGLVEPLGDVRGTQHLSWHGQLRGCYG